MKMVEPPLLITGAPRSGTSLTAHAFRACGAWVGKTTTQCENGRIREDVLKPILREGGMDELALRSFADVEGDPGEVRKRVAEILEAQGYDGGPWLYKDAKLVFCWRTWDEAFPRATWVTVWRPPTEIVASFGRWGLSKKIDFDGDRVVREHQSRARELYIERPGRSFVAIPRRLIEGVEDQYRRIADEYGIPWRGGAVRDVVDPERFLPVE